MIADSGDRRKFVTGAVRDMSAGKGRYDLLPWYGIEAVAQVMEEGASKYGERNWEQGIETWSFCDSGSRHLAKFMRGEADEPHLAQAAWNLLCALDTRRRIQLGLLPASLDTIGVSVFEGTPSGWKEPVTAAVPDEQLVASAQCPNLTDNCKVDPCADCDLTKGA